MLGHRAAAPEERGYVGQVKGKAALMLRLKRLRAMDAQARLRAVVEREQQDIMNMPDRSYRKFARQCWRQRMESARAVRCMFPLPVFCRASRSAVQKALRQLSGDRQ